MAVLVDHYLKYLTSSSNGLKTIQDSKILCLLWNKYCFWKIVKLLSHSFEFLFHAIYGWVLSKYSIFLKDITFKDNF